jgi:cytochrome P450
LIQPAFEMDTGGDAAVMELVRVNGLPVLGALIPIQRNALAFFSRVLEEHGDRVQLRVLGRKIILLCHPDDIEEVLVKDRGTFGRSTEIRRLRSIFGNGLLASDGAFWRQQRNMVQPSFQHSAMTHYASIMLNCISKQLLEWRIGEVRDIHADMMRYTRETICSVLFGSGFAASNPEIGHAVSVVFGDLRAEILYLPIWRRLPLIRSIRWNRAVKRLNRVIRRTIVARRTSDEAGDDLLGSLLTSRHSDGYTMSDEQLHDEVLTFFLTCHETAALSLTWATYLLATHPEIQERAAEEVFAVTEGGEFHAEHYPLLRFVTAVVKEALRLYPPVWSLGREATKDGPLGSLPIPKGTDLWLCLHRLHRDPRWYSEPERFSPERWLGNQLQRRFTYAPFGIGPRVCIGQHFAMTETVIGLAAILGRFRLSLASSAPATVDAWISLRPKERIELRVHEWRDDPSVPRSAAY